MCFLFGEEKIQCFSSFYLILGTIIVYHIIKQLKIHIMNKMQKDNHIFRVAMMDIIDSALDRAKLKSVTFEENTYDNSKDMVHFQYKGNKFVMHSIGRPIMNKGIIWMDVEVHREILRLSFDISGFRCDTLEKIACETYDYVKGEDWEEWDDFKHEKVGDWLMELDDKF